MTTTPNEPAVSAGSPTVEVALSKGRRLRVRRPSTAWEVTVQRHAQGRKGAGKWYTERSTVLAHALGEAFGDAVTERELPAIVAYVEELCERRGI